MRRTKRTNKDGSTVSYLQLAHNERHAVTGNPVAKVIWNFGREDSVDKDALRRLMQSIARVLDPEDQIAVEMGIELGSISIESDKSLGGAWALDQLWTKLGIRSAFEELLRERQFEAPVERAVFAMTANRALAPSSKLALEDWVENDVCIDGLGQVQVHQLYRAMDLLVENHEHVQERVFFSIANLLNLEVDLVYFDTTSTYFEVDPDPDEEEELRRTGYSKDHRPDLLQVVIGLAVTRDGIPVRCWVWPGNTGDMEVVAQVKKEARLDGKYLLRTSDDTLSPEDVALGYKQLLEVEDAFRTLKSTLDLRPMYHRVSDRIRAHVLLCWLALLLVRVAETQVGDTWPRIRTQLERIRIVEINTPEGEIAQRTDITPAQKRVLSSLGVPEPKKIREIRLKNRVRA